MVAHAPDSAAIDVSTLLLDVSRAAFNEALHQRWCRARAAGVVCMACLEYEADWLVADRALSAFLAQHEVSA